MPEVQVSGRVSFHSSLVISLDTVHVQAYQQARLADGVDQVLDNLRRLQEMARAQGRVPPRVGLEFVVMRSNLEWVDCGMACTFAEDNEDCWGNVPSCADCLWAQDIVRCP